MSTPTIDELTALLGEESPAFRAWVEGVPDKHWAKLDLSALRVGYELGLRMHRPAEAPGDAMLPIPVSAAREIAKRYGYDQVIVIARRVGDEPAPRGEHVTTYGRNTDHCAVAARVGDFLKHKIMGWPEYQPGAASLPSTTAAADALDAERYRFCRGNPAWETEAFLGGLSPSEYDNAIDTARAEVLRLPQA